MYDVKVAAGGFRSGQVPDPIGWMQVTAPRPIDERMFVAEVVGKSMEDGIPDGSLALFRFLRPGGRSATVLDGRRVLVQLRDAADPDGGGHYTLKRWRVTRLTDDGDLDEVDLLSDNASFRPVKLSAASGEVRAVAEFLIVVR